MASETRQTLRLGGSRTCRGRTGSRRRWSGTRWGAAASPGVDPRLTALGFSATSPFLLPSSSPPPPLLLPSSSCSIPSSPSFSSSTYVSPPNAELVSNLAFNFNLRPYSEANGQQSGYWGNLSGALVAHPTGGKPSTVGTVYQNLEDLVAAKEAEEAAKSGVVAAGEKKPVFLVYGRTGWIGGKLGKLLTEQAGTGKRCSPRHSPHGVQVLHVVYHRCLPRHRHPFRLNDILYIL